MNGVGAGEVRGWGCRSTGAAAGDDHRAVGGARLTAVTVSVAPVSMSVSLRQHVAIGVDGRDVLGDGEPVSLTAIGASLTAVMVTVTWPVSVRVPSETV